MNLSRFVCTLNTLFYSNELYFYTLTRCVKCAFIFKIILNFFYYVIFDVYSMFNALKCFFNFHYVFESLKNY